MSSYMYPPQQPDMQALANQVAAQGSPAPEADPMFQAGQRPGPAPQQIQLSPEAVARAYHNALRILAGRRRRR